MNKELVTGNVLEANISPKLIQEFLTDLQKIVEPHGIVMIKDGKKVLDINWEPYVTDMPHVDNSVSKTFVGITVGLCYDKGLVKLDEKVVDIFPDVEYDANNTMLKDVTVRNVLTMSMGQIVNPTLDGDREWVSALFNNPITFEPGTEYKYDSLATFLLCAIVQKKTGRKIIDILKEDVFAPMGVDKSYFLENKDGIAIGGLGLFVPTIALAKTGWMLTNKGNYNGTQILSEEWATMQISKQIENAPFYAPKAHESRNGYCFQCWKCTNGGTRMSGLWGQMCLMMPEYNFVMAINAKGSSSQPMLEIFDRTVLKALQNPAEYPATKEDYDEFVEYCSNLKTPLQHNDYVARIEPVISGREVVVTDDPYKVESFKATFKDEVLYLEIVKEGKKYHAEYGHNKLLKGINNLYDLFPPYYDTLSKPKEELNGFIHPNAYCQYYWTDESTCKLDALYDNEATHFNMILHFDYQCATFEWVPDICHTHTPHVYVIGTFKK